MFQRMVKSNFLPDILSKEVSGLLLTNQIRILPKIHYLIRLGTSPGDSPSSNRPRKSWNLCNFESGGSG
jgi:hypothetical protein